MMRKITWIIVFFIITSVGLAQDKQLTMRDAVIGQWMELRPERISQVEWKGEQDAFTYTQGNKLVLVDAASGGAQTLITLEEINNILSAGNQQELGQLGAYKWLDGSRILLSSQHFYYVIDIEDEALKNVMSYEKEGEGADFSAEAKAVAYTLDNNLFMATADNPKQQITNNQDKEVISGQSVSRREFHISKGTFWSPKGNFLAFYEKDVSDVWSYPIPDMFEIPVKHDSIKYPMAGSPGEHVRLGVYHVNTGEIVYIEDEPESEKYLTNITWGPDEKYIYIAVLNRDQDHMKMNQYDAKTGKLVKTLFEQKSKRYVEPYHKLLFLEKNPERFIYQTEQITGYSHLFLYNTRGERLKQLTQGKWVVTDVLGFDADEKYVFVSGTRQSPLERHIYRVSITDGRIKQLTSTTGTHSATISNSGNYFFNQYSSPEVPNRAVIKDSNGKLIKQLLDAGNPLKDYNLGEMEMGSLKAGDGETDLYYRLIKPENFNPDKKYPAIVYVYGGPHAQLVKKSWLGDASLWNYYMAQEGYVVLTVDNRGSANRGYDFESEIHRKVGQLEMQDQMEGVKMLKSLNYVDTSRIGVHGWSFGGFMTTSLMVNYPETFQVGVAGGPVIDWKFYEVMYGERYMDTPQNNPEGYGQTKLLGRAGDLEGQLYIIHGGVDPVVLLINSMQFVQEAINAGKPIDYFIYPRSEHNMRGNTRVHLKQKVTNYFNMHLK